MINFDEFDFYILQAIFYQLNVSNDTQKPWKTRFIYSSNFAAVSKLFNQISEETYFQFKLYHYQFSSNYKIYLKLSFLQERISTSNYPSINLMLKISSQFGFYDLIKVLVNLGANLNQNQPNLLTLACKKKHFKTAKELISFNLPLNQKDDDFYGNTPLICSIEAGSIELVKFLIQKKADIECANNLENTPVFAAIIMNQLEITKYLVSEGANLNFRNSTGNTALLEAVNYSRFEITEFLLSKDPNIYATNNQQQNCLKLSKERKNQDIINLIQDYIFYSEKNMISNYPDHIIENIFIYICSIYFNTGYFKSGFQFCKNFGLVSKLFQKISNQTKFKYQFNDDIYLNYQISFKLNYIYENINLMDSESDYLKDMCLFASEQGFYDSIKILGLQVDYLDINCLFFACRYGFLKTASEIIPYLKNINEKESSQNYSCLHVASSSGNLQLVKYLLQNNSYIESQDAEDNTPIFLAIYHCNFEIVEYLVSQGSNLDHINNEGNNPFLESIKYSEINIVSLLMSKKPNFQLRNFQEKSALDLAKETESTEIINLVTKHQRKNKYWKFLW